MLFWITVAVLTLGACLAVLLPMAGRRAPAATTREHDLEVYRDQLAEVDRDAGRGLIGEAEAEQARAEIGRRILRLGEAADLKEPGHDESSAMRWTALAAVLAVPLISWGIYAGIGSPALPAQPLQERLAKNPADSTIEELVARAEKHLAANPSDGQGWEVVAPIYLRMGRSEDALRAYENAIRLLGSNAAREAGLGEALTARAEGRVDADAQAAFGRALTHEPENPKARFYLATASAQQGQMAEAAAGLRAMIASAPADSPWRQAAEQALQRMADAPQAGPAQGDIEAAAGMSAEDRGAMIEGMVASLDERLRQNPRDKEGWKRLIRSYMVLGKAEQARDALERAIAALGAGSDEASEIEAFAATLQMQEADRQ